MDEELWIMFYAALSNAHFSRSVHEKTWSGVVAFYNLCDAYIKYAQTNQ